MAAQLTFPSIIKIGEKLSQMVMLKHFLPVTGHKSHHVTCHWAECHDMFIQGKKKQGEEKVILSAAITHLYLMPYKLLQKVIICFLRITGCSYPLAQWPVLCITSSLIRLHFEFGSCYTKPSYTTISLTSFSLQPPVAPMASWRGITVQQRAGRAHEMGGRFSQMKWNRGIFS